MLVIKLSMRNNMIDPTISKLVYCTVVEDSRKVKTGKIHGMSGPLMVVERSTGRKVKVGKRRLYLKFSILLDQYYLSNCY